MKTSRRYAMGAALISTALLAMLPTSAAFANTISLSSDVFVEKTVVDSSGRTKIVLEVLKSVNPGDNLRYVLKAVNTGEAPETSLTTTSPIPSVLEFLESITAGATVSVDRGQSWISPTELAAIKIGNPQRSATKSDVTHVRWKLTEQLAAGATKEMVFRVRVRDR